jgi:hypothetical protein
MFTTDGKPMKTGAKLVLGPDTDRLDSWKEIAVYLGREVRTAQRWERHEGLPVHRHRHVKGNSVCASKHEIDAWRHRRRWAATESALKEECAVRAAESVKPALLAAPRMPTKSHSWLQNAAAGVGSLDILQGEDRIRLYFYIQLHEEPDRNSLHNNSLARGGRVERIFSGTRIRPS